MRFPRRVQRREGDKEFPDSTTVIRVRPPLNCGEEGVRRPERPAGGAGARAPGDSGAGATVSRDA